VSAILGAAVGVALLVAYFTGLQKVNHHPAPPDRESVAIAAINFLGLSMGPVTHLMHTPGYDGVTVLGAAVLGLVAVTSVLLIRRLRDADRRTTALALGGFLGGFLCLAGGLAYGRAGMGNILGPSRYITLAMPITVTAYFAWVALGRGVVGRIVPYLLLAAGVAFLVPNTRHANLAGGLHFARLKQVEYDIKAGMPVGFVAERNRTIFPGTPEMFRTYLILLRDHGARPFADLKADPVLAREDTPVRVLRLEEITQEDGYFVADGKVGSVVYALSRRQHVYAVEVAYEGSSFGSLGDFVAFFSWDPEGARPPTRGSHILHNTMGINDPSVRLFVNCETDALRIDLAPETRIRVTRITILTPVP
jgi:hypothetical protein